MLVLKIIFLIISWVLSIPIIALVGGYMFGGVSGHAKFDLSDILMFGGVLIMVYIGLPVWLFL